MHYTSVFGDHKYSSPYSFSKSPEYKKYAVAAVKMQLYKVPPNSSVLWKATTCDEYYIDIIAKIFPKHKMLVAYRDIFPTLTSYYKSFFNFPILVYGTEVVNQVDLDSKWWFGKMMLGLFTNGSDLDLTRELIENVKPQTGFEWFAYLWAAKASTIRKAIEDGVNIKPIKYDSLVGNKKETIAKVFDYLDIPAENVDIACEALKYDSQAGIAMVSWESRSQSDSKEWSKDSNVIRRCNMILDILNLPNVNSSFDFPNSI